jgi:quinol monooxygenase YgiN
MLLANISFRVQPHKRAEALSGVESLVERMQTVAGCARSRVLTDVDDPNTFMLASEWND